jgi:hypothetical protein
LAKECASQNVAGRKAPSNSPRGGDRQSDGAEGQWIAFALFHSAFDLLTLNCVMLVFAGKMAERKAFLLP